MNKRTIRDADTCGMGLSEEPCPHGTRRTRYCPKCGRHTDSIERGDNISWTVNGEPRHFGFVVRRTTQGFQPAFAVREVCAGRRAGSKTVLARDVTKECG